jgi:tRNA-Thr(GGU) m(6)t(6)A37 methyltransferase TsaA
MRLPAFKYLSRDSAYILFYKLQFFKEAVKLQGQGVVRFIGVVEKVSDEVSNVRIFSEYCEGLFGLESFSHLIILYWLHERDTDEHRRTLRVIPKRHRGAPEIGVFGSRSPSRPNPIGFCVVKLLKLEKCEITVKGLDAHEGSPIIDIKPYIPRADSIPDARVPEWTMRGPPT